MEEQKNNVTESKVTQNENIEKVNTEVSPNAVAAKSETPPETIEQINWRKFRETRELERKEKLESDKRAAAKEQEVEALKAALAAVVNKPAPRMQEQSSNDYLQDESEEDRIRRQVDAAIADRDRIQEEDRRKRELQEYPARILSTYNDFNQVCTSENLDYLEYHYPEVAGAFKHVPDGYDKWASVYKAVKRLVPNTDSKREAAKAEKNFNKPQAMSIAGKTQVGDTAPQNLDDKRRSDNWARMQKVMKGG